MEDAWREHVGQLTLRQLHSHDDWQAHIDHFQVKLVSEGLQETTIGGLGDVHQMIAKLMCGTPAIPHARTMSQIATAQRDFFRPHAILEILNKIKERSMDGESTLRLNLHKLRWFKPWMRKEMVPVGHEFMPRVFFVLHEKGYLVVAKEITNKAYCVEIAWFG